MKLYIKILIILISLYVLIILYNNKKNLTSDQNIPTNNRAYTTKDALVLISTQFNNYLNWQTNAAQYSFKKVMPDISVLAIQSTEDSHRINHHKISPYSIVKDYTHILKNDAYAAFNRPYGLSEWLDREYNNLKDIEVFVIIDPDMVLRKPIDDLISKVKPGTAFAGNYWYMDKNNNKNTKKKLGLSSKLKLQGFGAPYIIHKKDLKNILPDWKKYTKRLRKLGGMEHPWIAEMRGYCVAAALKKVNHIVTDELMDFPNKISDPRVIHYTHDVRIDNKEIWDKSKLRDNTVDLLDKNTGLFNNPESKKRIDKLSKELVNIVNESIIKYKKENY